MLENKNYDDAVNQPYFKTLASRGQLLTNFHGLKHPSQPNYIGMISGSTDGVWLDNDVTINDRPTVVDFLEQRGKSWTAYQEDYPGNCFQGHSSTRYVRKHNPFISFPSISENMKRCARIVNSDQLAVDIAANNVADFVFYTPNMDNDGHDTNLNYAANWVQFLLDPLLENPVFESTLFVVTFDESEALLGLVDVHKNHIATYLLGAGVTPGSTDDTKYSHYDIVKTLENEWGLKSMSFPRKNEPIGFQKLVHPSANSVQSSTQSTPADVATTVTATTDSVTQPSIVASVTTSLIVASITTSKSASLATTTSSPSGYSSALNEQYQVGTTTVINTETPCPTPDASNPILSSGLSTQVSILGAALVSFVWL